MDFKRLLEEVSGSRLRYQYSQPDPFRPPDTLGFGRLHLGINAVTDLLREQSLACLAANDILPFDMAVNIVEDHEQKLVAQIAKLSPCRALTQSEINAIAKYAIVADELQHEPFMSEDNHEGVVFVGQEKKMHARFGHPAFLKSAILPFRKLWMPHEPCYFEVIRKLVFDLFSEAKRPEEFSTAHLGAYRIFFEEPHERSLASPIEAELATAKTKTVKQLVDLWIYTQGAHTGKTNELREFDEIVDNAGRARFENAFRSSIRLIGQNSYLSFNRVLVRPIFHRLLQLGYEPSFEFRAALKFGPYPKQTDRILLVDPFWHLDKECEEETFDRLIDRWQFRDFGPFFNGYFRARRPALQALKAYESLDVLLQSTGGVILDSASTTLALGSIFSCKGDMNSNGGKVCVYEGKAVYFADRSRAFLNYHYGLLRAAFIAHRETVPERISNWDCNCW